MVFLDGAPLSMEHARIKLEGQQFSTAVKLTDEGEPSVLGRVTLAMVVLEVDPVSNTLIPKAIN